MTEQVSPLRQRMIDDMSVRNMAPLPQASYVRAVKNCSKYFGKSPDKLTFEDVRTYQLHLVSRGLGPQALNQIMCALRFFYKTMLGIKDAADHISLARRSDPLPVILSREEVARFLRAVHSVDDHPGAVDVVDRQADRLRHAQTRRIDRRKPPRRLTCGRATARWRWMPMPT